jgi:hypothetical protein
LTGPFGRPLTTLQVAGAGAARLTPENMVQMSSVAHLSSDPVAMRVELERMTSQSAQAREENRVRNQELDKAERAQTALNMANRARDCFSKLVTRRMATPTARNAGQNSRKTAQKKPKSPPRRRPEWAPPPPPAGGWGRYDWQIYPDLPVRQAVQ